MKNCLAGDPTLSAKAQMDKLPTHMNDHINLPSEGALLDEFLDQLQREHAVKGISGLDTGFANLDSALDGLLPGLHLLIGAPSCGKTAFAKQLLDQVAMRNDVPVLFFSFAESLKELRIRTLSRLSGIESREIRRGSAYLLHWYGVPRLSDDQASELPASWEKLRRVAEEAKSWLNRVYLVQCGRETSAKDLESILDQAGQNHGSGSPLIVIDDSQRLNNSHHAIDNRLLLVAEELQQLATARSVPVIAVWPQLSRSDNPAPQLWSELVPSANTILFMEQEQTSTKSASETSQPIRLHVMQNRSGEKGLLRFEFCRPLSKFSESSGV